MDEATFKATQTAPEKRRPPVHPDDVVQHIEEIIAEQLPPDSGIEAEDAYAEIIEAVETAPRRSGDIEA